MERKLEWIEIDRIEVPRYKASSLLEGYRREMFESTMRKLGPVFEIVVIRTDDRYLLVDGENRVREARKLGMKKIKALVLELEKEEDVNVLVAKYSLISSVCQGRPDPIRTAEAIKYLYNKLGSVRKVAEEVGFSEAHVSRFLAIARLIESYDRSIVREWVEHGLGITDLSSLSRLLGTQYERMIERYAIGRIEGRLSTKELEKEVDLLLKGGDISTVSDRGILDNLAYALRIIRRIARRGSPELRVILKSELERIMEVLE